LPAIARAIADAHTYVTPTLATIRQLELQWEDRDSVLARAEIKFVNPETYAWWRTDRGHDSSANRRMEPFLKEMVRVFRDHGVRMLAGTDYYLFGLTPGFGLHRELQALVEAGVTPHPAPPTGTPNPPQVLADMGGGGAGPVPGTRNGHAQPRRVSRTDGGGRHSHCGEGREPARARRQSAPRHSKYDTSCRRRPTRAMVPTEDARRLARQLGRVVCGRGQTGRRGPPAGRRREISHAPRHRS